MTDNESPGSFESSDYNFDSKHDSEEGKLELSLGSNGMLDPTPGGEYVNM